MLARSPRSWPSRLGLTLLLAACLLPPCLAATLAPASLLGAARLPAPAPPAVYQHRAPAGRATDGECQACHQEERRYGHPVDFVPSRSLDAAYRLDPGGRFVCTTCHGRGGEKTGADRPVEGCAGCHGEGFFAAMADGGESINGLAHPLPGGMVQPEALDPVSVGCMSCHLEQADTRAMAAGGAIAGPPGHRSNHPVGGRYAEHVDYGGYVPDSRLPGEIRLPGGRLGCVSCHQSYTARHGAVVRLAAGGSLCSACHDI